MRLMFWRKREKTTTRIGIPTATWRHLNEGRDLGAIDKMGRDELADLARTLQGKLDSARADANKMKPATGWRARLARLIMRQTIWVRHTTLAEVIATLNESNEILADIPWKEGQCE